MPLPWRQLRHAHRLRPAKAAAHGFNALVRIEDHIKIDVASRAIHLHAGDAALGAGMVAVTRRERADLAGALEGLTLLVGPTLQSAFTHSGYA